ncbi:MAG: hypothetical protein AUI14_13075 [Actinobacteria bacterium 13_2_20CM_2_71_6]|nr:MAG: hypothetical protein AUI14_13075 [Actinobacteria bacterium 13_2_20CM_2_71_6]
MSNGVPVTAGPVLVLGGTGFLGKHICAAFRTTGAQVYAVGRHVRPVPADRCIPLDLSDGVPEKLVELLAGLGPSVVVNAAGAVWGVSEEQLVASNVVLVRQLVAAIATTVPRPRLVQLGSVHEYGPVAAGTSIDESTPTSPVAESLLGRVAQQLAAAARGDGEAVLRLAPLRALRDFVDVRDVADAVTAAATAQVGCAVVNIGSGAAVSVRALVNELIASSGVPALVEEVGEADAARSPGIEWQQVDIAAARTTLGWKPRRGMTDSLRDMWVAASAA